MTNQFFIVSIMTENRELWIHVAHAPGVPIWPGVFGHELGDDCDNKLVKDISLRREALHDFTGKSQKLRIQSTGYLF